MEKKTSIIIVTYNALEFIKKLIESLRKYTHPMHEIIIIDNNSQQETKDYLHSLNKYENFKIVFNKENRLWSPANNQGLQIASQDSEYCLLLNSDTEIFHKDWLLELQKPMNRFKNVGITGYQYNFSYISPTYGGIDGCCFLVRKKLFNELGYLDENYPWNGAGYIFTAKAWAQGWYYYFVNNPKMFIHYGKRSRFSSKSQLINQKVNKMEILKNLGLHPRKNYLALLRYHLKWFNINKYLEKKYLVYNS